MLKIAMLSGIYLERDERRANELCDALEMNVRNRALPEIHLRVEENPDAFFGALKEMATPSTVRLAKLLQSSKVVLSVLGKRSQYQDFFDYANDRLLGRIVVMVNADIGLDETIERVGSVDFDEALLVVSRGQYVWRPATCQDAWIFRPPFHVQARWTFGLPGSEVKLAYEAAAAGYRVCNPSVEVKIKHIHTSQKRSYKVPEDVVPGPHKETPPSDTRPVRVGRPRNKRAVVTTLDLSAGEVRSVTRGPMMDYASRIGAEFVEIADGPGRQMMPLFNRFDRIICLEPSILVSPDAPDLFKVVPEGKLGVANESFQLGVKGMGKMGVGYEKYGYAQDAREGHPHWNSNVLVADLWSAFLFDHPAGAFDRILGYRFLKGGPFDGTLHRDEVYLAVAARHFNLPIFEYHPKYNYLMGVSTYQLKRPFFANPKWIPKELRVKALKLEVSTWTSST